MTKIEVNGMLMEFDERLLIKQEVKVGDNVQVLIKGYSNYECFPGVITQLLPFADNPCIEVMYLDNSSYSNINIKKKVLTNKDDETTRIIRMDDKFLPFTKERAIDVLQSEITKKQNELTDAKLKLEYFLRYFGHYFTIDDKKE